jgi:diguanylate cyclase (GGDEF)-like protein/PAS domain S-box-containing protein
VIAPPYPINEAERLLALGNTGLLDTPPEKRFDRITRLAARFFGVETCLLSLVDSDRQWFKSRVGLEESQLSRDISFCGHTILDHGILTVTDAQQDARFSANPLVTNAPHIRFYAGAPVREPGGLPIGSLCIFDPSPRDFTDERKRELREFADMVEYEIARNDQADEQSKQMLAIVDNMIDGVISINNIGIIRTFSRGAEHIFGYTSDEMIGLNVNNLINSSHREHRNNFISNFIGTSTTNGIRSYRELEALHKDGTVFPIELGLAEVQQLGKINFIGIVRDITQRKKSENEIHQLAFYDAVTLLPNRRLLLDRLQQVIANCARRNRYAALLYLDLDNFKHLNDSADHNKGDLLLCQVAARLIKSVQQGDTVSRLGEDEFVVVIVGLSSDRHEAANQAEDVAAKICVTLAQAFDLGGFSYNGSASIGVTIFNSSRSSLEDLLKQANMAMYKAKASGRNSVYFFDPQMQVAVSLRAAMQQDLHEALRMQQFQVHYQKQVGQHGQLIGVEALLRWAHPTKGFISPAQFIPLAEETGLIVPIGEWVLREACQTLAHWTSDPAKANLTIAVNISVVQFNKKDIVSTVLNALNASGAKPHNLKLEITESLLASDVENVKVKMLELQRHGVTFSIDDFGTGYSSLFYLKQLPIQQLKIDQSFVRDIIDSPNDQAIAQAVITLAVAMQLNVIAEGVETEAQRTMLQDLGCSAYQGYLFGKPCALQDLFI